MVRFRLSVVVVLAGMLLGASVAPASAALPLKAKSCGAVVKSSFKLKNDMVCDGATALIIGKSGITIDLNGKTLTGGFANSNDTFGVENAGGFDDIVIRKGKIRGFDDGVKIDPGARDNRIIGIGAFSNSSDGIDIEGGRGHELRRVAASSNGDDGVDIEGGRLHLISDSRARNNEGDGFDIEANSASVLDSTARENDESGFEFAGTSNVIKRNYACENAGGNYLKGGTFTFKNNKGAAVC